jgi:hypothetical protein
MEESNFRDNMVNILRDKSPLLIDVTATLDMGYEFTAILSSGVIYPSPGMLLSYSNGNWPPDHWGEESDDGKDRLLKQFLEDEHWDVVPWEQIPYEEIEELFDIVEDKNRSIL